ncbi:MAG: hypothetical protein HY323_19085 [Betaproteobacteria bacterium]|nr:hypothetical protein [Betaproteobacteria bacterium]
MDDYLDGPGKLVLRSGNSVRISPDGWAHLDQLGKANPRSHLGFCAMWFDSATEDLWKEGLEPEIRNAGYQPFRIDKHEHVNKIDDEIVASIRRSKFVVADFTYGSSGVRGGVYFEAGFALALGLTVVWTCRKDLIHPEKIHFDVNHYNFLAWEPGELEDFRDRLTNRIEAIFGHGPYKTNTPS